MKNIFLIILIAACSFQSKAQVYLGAKLGLAPSLLSYQSLSNHKSQPSWLNPVAGIMAEIPIVWGFSIQPEVQFVTRGSNLKAYRTGDKAKALIKEGDYFSDYSLDNLAKEEDRDNGFADQTEQFKLPNLYENISVKLNYIEAHLMFKYEFMGGGNGLYIEVGPYYSMGISSKGKSTLVNADGKKTSDTQLVNNDASLTENYTDLIKSYTSDYALNFKPFKGDKQNFTYKKSDMGLAFGAGLYKDLDMGRLYFDGRILWGLKNINGKPNTSSTIKSRSLQISVTYLFPLGG
ncbi:MAG: outer membrane beta-barrel protein [Saprospiraceae bacterium]|nr:outer membrane beta-barrel protein [Saprospiraceae bacterium]